MSRREFAKKVAAQQDAIARRGFKPVRRELLRAMTVAGRRYEFSGTVVLPDDFTKRLAVAISAIHMDAVTAAVDISRVQAKSATPALEYKFDWPSLAKRFAFEFAETHMGSKIQSIRKTLIGNVTAIIKVGMASGEGQDAIAARILSVAKSITKTQAATVARTEVHGASGYAAMRSAEVVGDNTLLEQEWLTTRDGREREAHSEADGQRVPLGGQFYVGGEHLSFPGDPSGSAENVINCRCVAATVLKG